MCGIVGLVAHTPEEVLQRMIEAVSHRGPDGQGEFYDEAKSVALGHRRLAIIDLSEAGRQPMCYANRYWITFNGEIYNYQDLRAELIRLGYRFDTQTDTEVVLAAYAHWHERCVDPLRGMFAFAIYDSENDRIFLARDRFGIKPLYYCERQGAIVFASELKALLASGLIARRVDHQSVWDYLSLGSVPQPRTILADVRVLPPGHYATGLLGQDLTLQRYWDIAATAARDFPNGRRLNFVEAAQRLRIMLEEATRFHLVADVPVGAFLSGGMDSTTVVGLMSQFTSHPIRTFSVGFEDRFESLNELSWARQAAECFGTDHSEVIVTGTDIGREYDRLVTAIDQPSLDGTNSFFVSGAACRGVKVALSGLGGDELLAGYPHMRQLARAAAEDTNRPMWSRASLGLLAKLPRHERLNRWRFAGMSQVERYASIRNLASEQAKHDLTGPAFGARPAWLPTSRIYEQLLDIEFDTLAQSSYIEVNGYLANTLLRDVDAVSMAHSLEVRPVLLDHRLAEFVFSLSSAVKLAGATPKAVLAQAVKDLVPAAILNRPKQGFEMPLGAWLAGPLRERALANLCSPEANLLFSAKFLNRAKSALYGSGPTPVRLWAYVMLIEWMRANQCGL
jgi:asparagine synthase (glutamine-hydrolysing)